MPKRCIATLELHGAKTNYRVQFKRQTTSTSRANRTGSIVTARSRPCPSPLNEAPLLLLDGAREFIKETCASGLGGHHRHRAGGMSATLPAAAEEQRVRWVNDLRADGVPVTGLMLKLQARNLYATTAPSWGFHSFMVMEKAFSSSP
ncbi:hypothetical protein ON010_g12976 [Phytophthora cinnamomi]|nr:hypothetical protein ON010_g12976 [Phytophthora cinnamomi]